MYFSRLFKCRLVGSGSLRILAVCLILFAIGLINATPLIQSKDTVRPAGIVQTVQPVTDGSKFLLPTRHKVQHLGRGYGSASSSRNDINVLIGERNKVSGYYGQSQPEGTQLVQPSTGTVMPSSTYRRIEYTPSPSTYASQRDLASKKLEGCPRYTGQESTYPTPEGGRHLTDEEFRCMHIEEIKMQILKKLRMTSRPNTTIPRSMLPAPLVTEGFARMIQAGSVNRDIDDFYGKTEQVIVMAKMADHPTCNTEHHEPAGCFFFNVSDDGSGRFISSAELWAFKLRDTRDSHNQTYTVTEIVEDNESAAPSLFLVSIRETSFKDGWLKFDITTTIRRWMTKPEKRLHGLQISCKTCGMDPEASPVSYDAAERPFIVININSQATLKRNKRSMACSGNSTQCCKESLYVNFSDIGWNDWIIGPPGYHANYCKGSCIEDMTNIGTRHTTVMQLLIQNKINLTSSQQAEMAPCCTPTRMSSMNLLYLDNQGRIIMNTLPNMVVESCACF